MNQPGRIRTGSGPGSPSGQPAWGGGCDRPEAQPEIARLPNDANHEPLNLEPVATAPGSDVEVLFVQSLGEDAPQQHSAPELGKLYDARRL